MMSERSGDEVRGWEEGGSGGVDSLLDGRPRVGNVTHSALGNSFGEEGRTKAW